MKKAFDTIDRDYFLKTLKHLGFGDKFIGYIKCIFKGNYSTIISSGVKESTFDIERGTRQGDGISALLFLIALQPLTSTLKKQPDIRGIKIGEKSVKIELLADDTTLYINNAEEAQAALSIFRDFEKISGLGLNEDKSEILLLGKNPSKTKVGLVKT